MKQPIPVSLTNVAEGAAAQLFEQAFAQVLANIDDLSTDWKPARKIVLEFSVTTNEERRGGFVEMKCTTKLAGMRAIETPVFIGRHEGKLIAAAALPQEEMFTTPHSRPQAVAATGTED